MLSIPLHTKRLTLREVRESDWVEARALDTDPEVVRYLTNDVLDEVGTKAYLARCIAAQTAEPRLTWDLALTLRGDDRYVGRAGFGLFRPEHQEAMVWFQLRRDLWGQGLIAEALTGLLDLAFSTGRVHRCFGDCDPRNLGSARVMEKVGMKREAHLRENYWVKGEWCDAWIYGILAHEWPNPR